MGRGWEDEEERKREREREGEQVEREREVRGWAGGAGGQMRVDLRAGRGAWGAGLSVSSPPSDSALQGLTVRRTELLRLLQSLPWKNLPILRWPHTHTHTHTHTTTPQAGASEPCKVL